jgi:hypothetical protein
MSINSDFPSQLLMEDYEQMGKIMRFSLLSLLVNCSKDKNNNAKKESKDSDHATGKHFSMQSLSR